MSKTTVIHHSADFDGIFCREIARKFLPDAELIGWDFGDKPLDYPIGQTVYVMDLSPSAVFNLKPETCAEFNNLIWIDHHRTSIESHPKDIAGYRIDGVAACRLAWQWFTHSFNSGGTDKGRSEHWNMWMAPKKEAFVHRLLGEPLAVRLAGEYDICDKRDPRAELFQHGLRSREITPSWWHTLLSLPTAENQNGENTVSDLLFDGEKLQYARSQEYADVITKQGFDLRWEGLTFLACNSHELDIRSHLFEAGLKPHHQAMLGFTFSGTDWRVSMYGRPEFPDIDLSVIAKKHGGGGHKHACGFRSKALPWVVDRFLAWPLPLSVASDTCVTERGREFRSGTSLLDYDQTKLMFEYVFTR